MRDSRLALWLAGLLLPASVVGAAGVAAAAMTRDFTTLNTDVEYKLYARDVGQVLAIGVSGGSSREELVDYVPGS